MQSGIPVGLGGRLGSPRIDMSCEGCRDVWMGTAVPTVGGWQVG